MFIFNQMEFAAWDFSDSWLANQNYQWCYRHEMSDETIVALFGA
jgi:hypothetical protein